MTPLDSFTYPATTRSVLWRPILGTLIIAFFWLIGAILTILVYVALTLDESG